MLTESDLVEIMGYYHAGDNSKLLNVFQRFDLHDWVTECNEWKRKHAQEFSDFSNMLFRYCHQNIHPWEMC